KLRRHSGMYGGCTVVAGSPEPTIIALIAPSLFTIAIGHRFTPSPAPAAASPAASVRLSAGPRARRPSRRGIAFGSQNRRELHRILQRSFQISPVSGWDLQGVRTPSGSVSSMDACQILGSRPRWGSPAWNQCSFLESTADLSPTPTVRIGSVEAGSPEQSQGMRALSASMPTIRVFAMGDADHKDEQDFVPDCVDDAVITHADAPEIFRTCHLQASARPRL